MHGLVGDQVEANWSSAGGVMAIYCRVSIASGYKSRFYRLWGVELPVVASDWAYDRMQCTASFDIEFKRTGWAFLYCGIIIAVVMSSLLTALIAFDAWYFR